jgi:hypothetical protein
MNETPKVKITREDIYKNEEKISNEIGERYNNTMCHRMKEKDTFKTINPTAGLWKNDLLYKTTNEVMQPSSYKDPYHDETFFLKMDFNKRFNEEMAKAKNMMMVKKKDQGEKKEK